MKSIVRRTGALVAATALAFTLASCAGGQSVQEACQVAQKAASEANLNTSSLMQDAMSGTADFATLFEPAQQALADAESQVTNGEVSTALKNFNSEFKGLVDDLSGLEIPDTSNIDPTNPDAMAELEKMQDDLQVMSGKLEERSVSLTEAGEKLNSLCSAG